MRLGGGDPDISMPVAPGRQDHRGPRGIFVGCREGVDRVAAPGVLRVRGAAGAGPGGVLDLERLGPAPAVGGGQPGAQPVTRGITPRRRSRSGPRPPTTGERLRIRIRLRQRDDPRPGRELLRWQRHSHDDVAPDGRDRPRVALPAWPPRRQEELPVGGAGRGRRRPIRQLLDRPQQLPPRLRSCHSVSGFFSRGRRDRISRGQDSFDVALPRANPRPPILKRPAGVSWECSSAATVGHVRVEPEHRPSGVGPGRDAGG
jgi:hypothetical protein